MTTEAPDGIAVILGSVNVDTFIYVDDFPAPGETILAGRGEVGLGGKGANQAVAASLLGTRVDFIGRVGDDGFADYVRQQFDAFGIDGQALAASTASPTGAAYITVNAQGENTICVVSGANVEIETTDVENLVERSAASAQGRELIALAQGETAGALTDAFARECRSRGIRFVLNLAPFLRLDDDTMRLADPLIVNEGEAGQLLESVFGQTDPLDSVESAKSAAKLLAERLCPSVVITLGADGAVAAGNGECWHQPAPVPKKVVDTTGAGDAFVGAVVSVLARGDSLREAVRWGVAAGSIAVERRGTTLAYPTLAQLEQSLPTATFVGAR
ncbi:ribokinase [Arthrobacter sp. SDTb3-6]|uniref:ribokinase n=1 Tax=Arthrobacter sp. SDTb3-6 TaxID=2713571 RepID=UPI00159E1BB1|nr:ribokinase [Arthrobacter sp. SDTb3-6]NVN00415.1 ribokinase [Arthrobacter sp. SDTb3-6]